MSRLDTQFFLVPLIEWELVTLVLLPVLSVLSTTTTTSVGFASRSLEATILGSADSPVYKERASGSAALVIEGSRNDIGVVAFFIRLNDTVSTATTFKCGFGICHGNEKKAMSAYVRDDIDR